MIPASVFLLDSEHRREGVDGAGPVAAAAEALRPLRFHELRAAQLANAEALRRLEAAEAKRDGELEALLNARLL